MSKQVKHECAPVSRSHQFQNHRLAGLSLTGATRALIWPSGGLNRMDGYRVAMLRRYRLPRQGT